MFTVIAATLNAWHPIILINNPHDRKRKFQRRQSKKKRDTLHSANNNNKRNQLSRSLSLRSTYKEAFQVCLFSSPPRGGRLVISHDRKFQNFYILVSGASFLSRETNFVQTQQRAVCRKKKLSSTNRAPKQWCNRRRVVSLIWVSRQLAATRKKRGKNSYYSVCGRRLW